MEQDVFRFKQFAVVQQRCGMRVGTDGVLLGAWASVDCDVSRIWDVGCGSGLIALMLAQRCNARIWGVEIDAGACCDAELNFRSSLWCDRLKVVKGDFLQLYDRLEHPDLIVSNPPFFKGGLKNDDIQRCGARHEGSLGVERLVSVAAGVLSDGGRLCMVTPVDRAEDVETAVVFGRMTVERRTEVVTVEGKRAKRILWQIVKGHCENRIEDRIVIYSSPGIYSDEFVRLTNSFYLNL